MDAEKTMKKSLLIATPCTWKRKFA